MYNKDERMKGRKERKKVKKWLGGYFIGYLFLSLGFKMGSLSYRDKQANGDEWDILRFGIWKLDR
jgi:hypothetical protein